MSMAIQGQQKSRLSKDMDSPFCCTLVEWQTDNLHLRYTSHMFISGHLKLLRKKWQDIQNILQNKCNSKGRIPATHYKVNVSPAGRTKGMSYRHGGDDFGLLKVEIRSAAGWLRLMKRNYGQSYLLIVEFSVNKDALFGDIANVVRPYLKDMYIDIVPHGGGFGKDAAEGAPPFYEENKRPENIM